MTSHVPIKRGFARYLSIRIFLPGLCQELDVSDCRCWCRGQARATSCRLRLLAISKVAAAGLARLGLAEDSSRLIHLDAVASAMCVVLVTGAIQGLELCVCRCW